MLKKLCLTASALAAFAGVALIADRAEAGGPRGRYYSHSSSFYASPSGVHRSRSSVYVAPPLPIYGRPYGSYYRPLPAPVPVHRHYVDPFYGPRGYYGSHYGYGYGSGMFLGSPGFSIRIGF